MSKGRRAPGVEERGGGSVAAHLDSAQAINSLFHPSALLNCSPRSGPCPEGGGCCHQKAIRVVSNADMSCITGNRNKLSAFPLRNNDNSCRKNWQRIYSQNFVSGWVIWFLTMGIDCERVSWGWTTFWTRQSCFLLSKTADDTCFQPWNNHQIISPPFPFFTKKNLFSDKTFYFVFSLRKLIQHLLYSWVSRTQKEANFLVRSHLTTELVHKLFIWIKFDTMLEF